MALTAPELLTVRSYIGNAEPPTDADLQTLSATLTGPDAVAHHVLRQRLADLRSAPTSVTYVGDMSENWEGTIRALERQVETLGHLVGAAGTGLQVGYLERDSYRR